MKMIDKIKCWIRENPHCLALTYGIFYLAGFLALETRKGDFFLIDCPLDDKIPFMEIFVIPYVSWFLLIGVSLAWTMIARKQDFLELCLLMFGGTTFCLAVYWFFPNGLNLRPQTVPDNPFGWLVGFLYSMDTATNVCPSIHVSSSVAVGLIARKFCWFSSRPMVRWLLYIWIILICLSTMMIKQHSIVDVVCGVLLSLALFPTTYLRPGRWRRRGPFQMEKMRET